ncbi:MAG: TIGR03960 family B12-binding radical SAM protein [Candidatus Aminicenantes bacterium]|nr:TIGR03960 family B12-binding radical SAM protein [Candidatus Aminicenantes bacterium]MDH5704464.1 TIGR03960 family B12-binding radical SAM protein [Candidatus Aminicenantes bacterium]
MGLVSVKKLSEILKDIEKPGRYLGGEWNEVRKDPARVKIKVALAFPDLYDIGMSYLGQKILYFLLNGRTDILAERVFTPWADFEQKLRAEKIPLYSLENKIPLDQFDILGFSLLYELNYSNILTTLDLGGIPLHSAGRNLDHPLVIAGGPAAFNPEPVADIFDLFLIGDGEEAFLEIIDRFLILKKEFREKAALLNDLSQIEGVYVPSLYPAYLPSNSHLLAVRSEKGAEAKIKKRVLFPFHEAPFPEEIVVPNVKIIFDRVSVEVARGCPQKCRFCQASSIYLPPRVKSPSFVIENIMNSLQMTGYEGSSLAALSVSDYPYLDRTVEILMKELAKQKVSLSLPSLRPKGLSSDLARSIIKVRKTGFTLVPEAGTERLRRVINKKLEDEDIFEASRNAFSQGWRLLKLYFMVGLPTEREEDLEGIVDIVQGISRIGCQIMKSTPQINLSLSSFIPKPHTPFQWLEMEEEQSLQEKYRFLMSRLRKHRHLKIKKQPLKNSLLEAVFSRGDRRLNNVLLKAWKIGARFDSWSNSFSFQTWEQAFIQEKLDYHLYLSAINKDVRLPWEHIDTGINKSYLLRELDKAWREEYTHSCLEDKCGSCQGCSFPTLLEREFPEDVKVSPVLSTRLGKKTEKVHCYRVFFSKHGTARFISHNDLNNVIQRGFRRAGIAVDYTQGFHPKMMISHPPALPLGMEGKSECFEFKSHFLFQEDEFISRLNACLPPGIKILNLERRGTFPSSLGEEIETLIYSIDLKNPEVQKAVKGDEDKEIPSSEYYKKIEERLGGFLAENPNDLIDKTLVDKEKGRIYLYIRHNLQKAFRAQEFTEKIFGIKNSSFIMSREKIVFHKHEKLT